MTTQAIVLMGIFFYLFLGFVHLIILAGLGAGITGPTPEWQDTLKQFFFWPWYWFKILISRYK